MSGYPVLPTTCLRMYFDIPKCIGHTAVSWDIPGSPKLEYYITHSMLGDTLIPEYKVSQDNKDIPGSQLMDSPNLQLPEMC